jgi:hypothetical protein
MIDVVDYEMTGWAEYFTVHPDPDSIFPWAYTTDGIESVTALDSMPFVLIQSLEIFRVDDGVFSLSKRYPAESVAVAGPAVI